MVWLRLIFWLIPAALIGVGVWLWVSDSQAQSEARGWSEAEGIVLSSRRLDPVVLSDGRRGNRYSVAVTYRYSVNGRSYTNDRVWLTQNIGWATPDAADAFLENYREGAGVSVLHDPEDPRRSVLAVERGSFLPLMFIGLGLVALVTVFRAVRPGRAPPRPRKSQRRSRPNAD